MVWKYYETPESGYLGVLVATLVSLLLAPVHGQRWEICAVPLRRFPEFVQSVREVRGA